jgi:hypothetical protein
VHWYISVDGVVSTLISYNYLIWSIDWISTTVSELRSMWPSVNSMVILISSAGSYCSILLNGLFSKYAAVLYAEQK